MKNYYIGEVDTNTSNQLEIEEKLKKVSKLLDSLAEENGVVLIAVNAATAKKVKEADENDDYVNAVYRIVNNRLKLYQKFKMNSIHMSEFILSA